MGNNKLTGKLILKATVTNTSPLIIANGKGDVIDFEVIKDRSGMPFIPASGFAGMIKEGFREFDNPDASHMEYFWGCDETKRESQSHIIIEDLKAWGEFKIVERDGVAIDHKTNLGLDRSKYDYEIVEPGTKFLLNAEITTREGFDKNIFLRFLYFIARQGELGRYRQGAFKSAGFGVLTWSDIRIMQFDFPADAQEWFRYLRSGTAPEKTYTGNHREITLKDINVLTIEGEFSIKNSLIIRSDGDQTVADAKSPDKTHLKNSSGVALLTGKTIKGAIRHRALKILNTMGSQNTDSIVKELFGYVNEVTKDARPSRVSSFETKVEHVEDQQIQPRIKIDRFTGSTIEHALMQSQPLWHKDESFTLIFEIEECKAYEAGLMLLVMKDLMNEDLPLGGEKTIGRGLLTGRTLCLSGKISTNEGDITLNKGDLTFTHDGITDRTKINIINGWITELSKI